MRALSISVYRNNRYGDCTNGGISSRYDELLCLCDDGPVVIDPDNPPENLVKIVRRDLFGRVIYHVEPYAAPTDLGWMMGGN